jgi:hypothetical protein
VFHQEKHELYPGVGAYLIKYYGYSDSIYGRNTEDFYSIEYDVKTLLWLSRVNLGIKIK